MPSATLAQSNITLVPSLAVMSVYDDNLFAMRQSDAGQMLVFRPSIDAIYEAPRLKTQGLASFDMLRSNHSSLNTLDARRTAFLDTKYRTTNATTLSLVSSYDQTETPGELNFDTGILGDRQRAWRVQLTPGMSHRIGERMTVGGSFDWIAERLDRAERMDLQVVRGNFGRRLTTRDTFTVGLVGRRFIDPISVERSAAALVGYTRELAFGTELNIQGGPRFSSYKPMEPEFLAAITRRTNRMRLLVDYWHGETIVLGIHGPVRVDSLSGRISWPLTRTIEIGAHAGASDISTLDQRLAVPAIGAVDVAVADIADIDLVDDRREVRTYRGTLVASWKPHDLYTVAASYGVDLQQGTLRRLFVEPEVVRHVFRVSMTIAPRISRFIEPSGEGPAARPRR